MPRRFPNPVVSCALTLAALCAPAILRAQFGAQFSAPEPDELKMTADPKAPGAAAVYMNREETEDQGARTQTIYERIKVLTEKGKELATIRIPYEVGGMTVTDIDGRTIHGDGTVIPFKGPPSDLVDFKTKEMQIDTLVMTLPSVEVGSILEYRFKRHFDKTFLPPPQWEIQEAYFVHKAHYSFKPIFSLNLTCSTRIHSDAKVVRDDKGGYTLDIADVPPTPDEDWMPPAGTFRWRVEFYHAFAPNPDVFWQQAETSWGKGVQEFINPTGTIRKAAESLVTPSDPEHVKAEKLYAAIMKLDNTDFTREKSQAERKKEKLKPVRKVEDVWKQQSGNGQEIALLYVALARAAGLTAWPMQVVDRNRAIFDRGYLSAEQLDDFLAIVTVDGKEIMLDPGQKMCPYGHLHWAHTMATGFRMADGGAKIASTPGGQSSAAVLSRVADLTIDADGSVKGTLRFVMTGPAALYWRQLTLRNDQDEVKKQFNDSLDDRIPEGVHADFDHFLALEDYDVNLIAVVKVSGSLGAATGKRFFLPGMFFESRAHHPFVAEDKRLTPIDVHYPETEEDDVTYRLPPGYTVESAPPATHAAWPDHATLTIASTTGKDSVKVERTLTYNYTLLDAKAYPDLHDFYQKVATADQQQIVLARAAAAKGN